MYNSHGPINYRIVRFLQSTKTHRVVNNGDTVGEKEAVKNDTEE